MNRQSAILSATSLLALMIALFFFHFRTLAVPTVTDDEACLANIALHGNLQLWEGTFPKGQEMLQNIYGRGLDPVYRPVFHRWMQAWGVGPKQIRFLPFLGGTLGLFIFALLFRKKPRWSFLLIAIIGMSPLFFFAFHSDRAEGIVFLITILNIYWILSSGSKTIGLLAGVLAGLGAGIHLQIAFLLFCVPFLVAVFAKYDSTKLPRFAWWAAGLALGLVTVLHLIDIEPLMLFLSLQKIGGFLVPQHANVVAINLNQIINPSWPHSWDSILWGLMTAAACLSARRFGTLAMTDRLVLCLAVLNGFFLLFINRSLTTAYQIFVFPWLIANLFIAVDHLWCGNWKTDNFDWIIFYGFLLLSINYNYAFHTQSVAAVGAVLLLGARLHWQVFKRKPFLLITIFLVYLILKYEDILLMFGLFQPFFRLRPILTLLMVCAPWLLLRGKERLTLLGVYGPEKTLAVLLSTFVVIFSISGINGLRERIDKARNDAKLIKNIGERLKGDRILAPPPLWVYFPNRNIRSTTGLDAFKGYRPNFDLADTIVEYKPSYYLCPRMRGEKFMEESRFRHSFMTGMTVPTPWGEFLEILPLEKPRSQPKIRRALL